VTDFDREACGPPESLSGLGVRLDNADLLKPSDEVAGRARERLLAFRAARVLREAGTMSGSEFADVLRKAAEMISASQ